MMRQATLSEGQHGEKKDERRRVHEVRVSHLCFLQRNFRCQDQQVQNQAGWLRIDGVEVDTIREATVGVLEIPKG